MRKCNGLAVLKETCKREIGLIQFYEMELSKKTNRLAAQKDQKNI